MNCISATLNIDLKGRLYALKFKENCYINLLFDLYPWMTITMMDVQLATMLLLVSSDVSILKCLSFKICSLLLTIKVYNGFGDAI